MSWIAPTKLRLSLLVALLLSNGLSLCIAPVAAEDDDLRALLARYSGLIEQLEEASSVDRENVSSELRGVLEQIGQSRDRGAVLFLARQLSALSGRHPDLAAECAHQLLQSGEPKAVSLVLSQLGFSDPMVQLKVLGMLATMDVDLRPHASAIILATLYVEDKQVRDALVPVLTRLGTPQSAEAMLAKVERWEPWTLDDPHLSYDACAWAALAEFREPAVREWFAGPAFDRFAAEPVQLAFLAALAGHSRNSSAMDSLLRLTTHVDVTVRAAALEAVTLLGSDDARVMRAWALRREPSGSSLPLAAVRDLALEPPCAAPGRAIELTKAEDPAVRLLSFGRLSSCDGLAVVEALVDGLTDREPAVRLTCSAAILRKRERSTVDALLRAHVDHDANLRLAATELLVELTGLNMGSDTDAWNRWWDVARESFEFSKARPRTFVTSHSTTFVETGANGVCFLVDVSSGMRVRYSCPDRGNDRRTPRIGPTGLDLLTQECKRLLREVVDHQLPVNIVAFGTDTVAWHAYAAASEADDGDLERFVDELHLLHAGENHDVLEAAEFALMDRNVGRIVLVTDGRGDMQRLEQPSEALQDALTHIAERIPNASTMSHDRPSDGALEHSNTSVRTSTVNGHDWRIPIDCIAIGSDSDLLRRIASSTGGAYRSIGVQCAVCGSGLTRP